MSIQIDPNYPESIRESAEEYNDGFADRQIDLVEASVNSLTTMVFSKDDSISSAAAKVLSDIGMKQPAFLKNAVRVLLARQKGSNEVKAAQALFALGEIFVGKPAAKFITDQGLLQEITDAHNLRVATKEKSAAQAAATMTKSAEKINIDDFVHVPEVANYARAYNDALLTENLEEAFSLVGRLIQSLYSWYSVEPTKFILGNVLLGKLGSQGNRKDFFKNSLNFILKQYAQGEPAQKTISSVILQSILSDVEDIIAPTTVQKLKQEIKFRMEEQRRQSIEAEERRRKIKSMQFEISIGWSPEVKELAQSYNDAISTKKDAQMKKALKALYKLMDSKEERLFMEAADALKNIFNNNPETFKNSGIFDKIIEGYTNEKESYFLGLILPNLRKLKEELNINPFVLESIEEDLAKRMAREEAERKKAEAEAERIRELSVKINGKWNTKVLELAKSLNENFIAEKSRVNSKIIDKSLNELLMAENDALRADAQELLANIATKYWGLAEKQLEKYAKVYASDSDNRHIAIDLFGLMTDGKLRRLLEHNYPDIASTIDDTWEKRLSEVENDALAKKIGEIRFNVTSIKIRDHWNKKLTPLVLKYNNAMKKEIKNDAIEVVQTVVDTVLNERNDERQQHATEFLGLIAAQNIELVAPSIQIIIHNLESSNSNVKVRAINALGEVCKNRPGWAYMGIEKLMGIASNKAEADDFRQKSMRTISEVAKSDALMLLEFLDVITGILQHDPNSTVRTFAAFTLKYLAESIPDQMGDAMKPLQDATHDESIAVRRIADSVLTKIREGL